MAIQPISLENRSNFRNLYADIFWFGILAGSTAAFLAIYAARLGATNLQVGLLTAGPAMVNLMFSLPMGHALEGKPLIRPTFISSVLHRLGYLLLIPLAWLFNPEQQIWAILILILLMSIPATVLSIGFNAMFADLVPPNWRATVVGRRNALLAVSITVTSLLCGQLLDRIVFPLNYQVVFALGAAGGLMSSYHLSRLRRSETAEPALRSRSDANRPLGDTARQFLMRVGDSLRPAAGLRYLTRAGGKPLLRLDLLRGPFGLFLAAYLLFYTFQYVPLPLFSIFFVRELHLTDSAISLGTALFQGIVTIGSLWLVNLSTRFSHRHILVTGALLFGHYPLLLAFAQSATLFWIVSFTGGLVWALLGSGLLNRLMERVPEENRPAYMALHNLALNVGILAGSLVGPLLGEWMGLREALLLSAGLRLLGGLLLLLWA
jgi:predicted MFS family arabinose efflux permease